MARTPFIRRLPLALVVALALPGLFDANAADEFSSGDKVRTLYSSHFAFTDDGYPQVTVGIMDGQKQVHLGSSQGLVVMPDGEGGARIKGAASFDVSIVGGRPALLKEWSVLERFSADEALDAEVAVAKWKKKGHEVRTFEIGTVFAVAGDVLDTREILVAVDPVARGKGQAKSRALGKRYDLTTSVHTEMVRSPSGTIVARSGDIEIKNSSMLWFKSAKAKGHIEVEDVVVGGGGSQLDTRRQDRRYHGSVYVTIDADGKLSVANAVAADDLLSGLVPSEMFPVAPMEALKAQSVAARTELLQKLGTRHFGDPYLLCSTQHCQVYSGVGHEHPRTTKAVHETRGQVLLDHEEHLVDARYSATCGGHSEHNDAVWDDEPNPTLRGHLDGPVDKRFSRGITNKNISTFLKDGDDAYCAKTKYSKGRFRWSARLNAADLSKRVASQYPSVGGLRELRALRRGISGRIVDLELVGDKGRATVHGELVIRRLLGGLRSSLFNVTKVRDSKGVEVFEIKGAGFGHGVGMCQLGAIGMASNNVGFAQILTHYYRKSSLHKLY